MKDMNTHVLIEEQDQVFAQGDVFFTRLETLPPSAVPAKTTVIAHSETGHHHVARDMHVFSDSKNPDIGYLVFKSLGGDTDALTRLPRIEHERATRPHRSYALKGEGVIQYTRQQEWMPEGYSTRLED